MYAVCVVCDVDGVVLLHNLGMQRMLRDEPFSSGKVLA